MKQAWYNDHQIWIRSFTAEEGIYSSDYCEQAEPHDNPCPGWHMPEHLTHAHLCVHTHLEQTHTWSDFALFSSVIVCCFTHGEMHAHRKQKHFCKEKQDKVTRCVCVCVFTWYVCVCVCEFVYRAVTKAGYSSTEMTQCNRWWALSHQPAVSVHTLSPLCSLWKDSRSVCVYVMDEGGG